MRVALVGQVVWEQTVGKAVGQHVVGQVIGGSRDSW